MSPRSKNESPVTLYDKQRLASYKVPRRFLFPREDELTMTGGDKVKAGALRQHAVERLGAALRT